MGKRLEINKGKRIGKLTIIKEVDRKILPSGQPNRVFKCLCDCGNEKEIRLVHLKNERTLSCGCIKNICGGDDEKKYIRKIWRAIKYRTKKNYFQSHLYYDKGIRVCDEWMDNFNLFYEWAKKNNLKKGTHIDRINGDKGYCPENCRVVSPEINCNNRVNTIEVVYKNKKYPIMVLLRKLNKTKHMAAIRSRIKRGWEHEKAIDTPIKRGKYGLKKDIPLSS